MTATHGVVSLNDCHEKTPFLFDKERVALLTNSPKRTVLLSGKPCEILACLMAAPNHVLSVSEIQKNVWDKTVVTTGSVKDYIAQIRTVLNDSATRPKFIETIRGRGYRYIGNIAILNHRASDHIFDHVGDRSLQPTLAIIPPVFNDEPNQKFEMVGEVIAANLIDTISSSPLINIISRLSTRQFKDSNSNVNTIGKSLGAEYVLSGLYHRQNNLLQLYIELSHCFDSTVVWADKLSGTVADWSNENSEITQQLTRTISAQLVKHQIDLTSSEPLESLEAHTLIINAVNYMHNSSQSIFDRAEKLLQHTLTKLPDNASVLSLLAQWHLMRMNRSQGWNLNNNTSFKDSAFSYAAQALDINPLHSHANTIIGSLEARLNNNFDKARDHHSTAMQSNPNNPLNHCFKASVSTYQDDPDNGDIAVFHAEKAIALSPLDPQLYLFKTVAAAANQYAGNYEAAYRSAAESYELNPNHTSNLRTLISILIDLDQANKAAALKDKLMSLDPTFNIKSYREFGPGIKSQFGQHIANNLEQAGIPLH